MHNIAIAKIGATQIVLLISVSRVIFKWPGTGFRIAKDSAFFLRTQFSASCRN